jgi:hypothetical protein
MSASFVLIISKIVKRLLLLHLYLLQLKNTVIFRTIQDILLLFRELYAQKDEKLTCIKIKG